MSSGPPALRQTSVPATAAAVTDTAVSAPTPPWCATATTPATTTAATPKRATTRTGRGRRDVRASTVSPVPVASSATTADAPPSRIGSRYASSDALTAATTAHPAVASSTAPNTGRRAPVATIAADVPARTAIAPMTPTPVSPALTASISASGTSDPASTDPSG